MKSLAYKELWKYELSKIAAKHNRLEILKYLKQQGYEISGETVVLSFMYSDLETIKWLLNNYKVTNFYTIDRKYMNNREEIFDWLNGNNYIKFFSN
jgi:hypothetical protein